MSSTVVVLPGDGIGPEVTDQATRVLETVAEKVGLSLEIREALLGGAAFEAVGKPLPEETLALCRDADAIFLGAVGGPQWDDIAVELRPERGLLGLRQALGLFANLRPVKTYPELVAEFINRGYSEPDIAIILGGNLLRVWREVESFASAQ